MGISRSDGFPIHRFERATVPCPDCGAQIEATQDYDGLPLDGWIAVRCVLCPWSDRISWEWFRSKADQVNQSPQEEKANAGVVIDLGARLISIQGRVIGTCHNLSITIDEATDDEVRYLKGAGVIQLIKDPKYIKGE